MSPGGGTRRALGRRQGGRVKRPRSDDRDSLESRAYRALKQAVLEARLKPGQRISQNEWAARLGISRTPVREALKRLSLEGLAIAESARDWRVYTLGLDDVRRLYEAREGAECMIARLAAERMSEQAGRQAAAILARMEKAAGRDDRSAFREADVDLHRLLERLADNAMLAQASRAASDRLARLRRGGLSLPGRIEGALEENRLIVEALRSRDPDAAERAQRRHLRASAAALTSLLEELVVPLVGPRF